MISAVPQRDRAAELIREFLISCKPQRLRPVGEWAESELRIPSGPFSGRKYRLDRLPYARHLLGEFGKWRRVVVTGPTQSGKSLNAFVIPVIYYLFEMKEDVICGVPDLTMSGEKWQKDIKPLIEASGYADQLPTRGAGSQGGNPVMITFKNGKSLRFMAGGGGDKQRAGSTGRVLVITETDGMDEVSATSKEGQDKISQLEGRVRSYGEDALIFMECTVTTEDGRTWREYELGTRSRIACPCPHCDQYVTPEREHLMGWQDSETKIQAGESASWTCPDCGGFINEDQRREMNEKSILVHNGQEVTPDGEIVGAAPETDTLGFRWNAFNNLLTTARLIAMEEWQAAQSEDVEASQTALKQQVHCLPSKNANVEKVPISVGIVRGSDPKYAGRCSGLLRGVEPAGFDVMTCFIDLSRRLLQWSIECKVDRRIHVIDYGFEETEAVDIVGDEVAITDAIKVLTERLHNEHPDLHLGLIDCGNWREATLNCVATLPDVWRCSHGLSNYKHPAESNKDKEIPQTGSRNWHWSSDDDGVHWVVNFDPNILKHQVHSGFMLRPLDEPGQYVSGAVTLFGDDPQEHTEYAMQITAEEFVTEFTPGKGAVSKWVKKRKANHMLDGAVGNKLARLVVDNWRLIDQQNEGKQTTEIQVDPRLERFIK